jgi:cardiolipin synthase A/B
MSNYRLLTNGTEAFPAICQAIDAAKKTIIVKMFVWRDDPIGNRVLKHLLDAANRGVLITIIKDRFAEVLEKGEENKQSLFHKPHTLKMLWGSFLLDNAYPMNKPKGYAQVPNPLLEVFSEHDNVTILREIELKDHTKFYLIDDEIFIFGGINNEEKEFSHDYLKRTYHDYMIEVRSHDFVRRFQERFYQSRPYDETEDDFILNQGERKEIEAAILALINAAQKRIVITMAYFGADSAFQALSQAAKRGVNIDILTSAHANLQADYNRKFLQKLYVSSPEHVTIRLADHMIHAKVMICDDTMTIGSANLNNRGFSYLGELNLVSRDPALIDAVIASRNKAMQGATLVNNKHQLDYIRWRAFLERFAM